MTSNPAIFEKAIAGSTDYDADIERMAAANRTALEIYEALAISDIREAADHLSGVYEATGGADGFVSRTSAARATSCDRSTRAQTGWTAMSAWR